jgi:hypothetical protein
MLSPRSNVGYYKTGGKLFTEKIEAVIEANKTKADIEWEFNNDIWDSVDWTKEPTLSLNELYKLRAQQIRDKYDYLVLFSSGGSDSRNMAYAFLKNGIHLDEIVAGSPESGLNNWKNDLTSHNPENTITETVVAQMPFMHEISVNYPNVKLTNHDYFIDMVNYKPDEWIRKCGNYIHPTYAARYNLERYSHLRKILDSGKTIGFIYGIDKPYITIHNGMVWSLIYDYGVSNAFQSIDHPLAKVELFYWSHDLPEIVIKQSHVVSKVAHLPENLYTIMDTIHNDSRENYKEIYSKHSTRYQRAIIPYIYPMLEEFPWQCAKPALVFMGEHDAWFDKLHKGTTVHQKIMSDYNRFIKSIDPKYFRTKKQNWDIEVDEYSQLDPDYVIGFKPCIIKKKIGPVSNFQIKS